MYYVDIAETKTLLKHYDTVLKINRGFIIKPIRHISAVQQDDKYKCGTCVLIAVIIYLYRLTLMNFPWYTLNYRVVALHVCNIVTAMLTTSQLPSIRIPIHTPLH